MKIVNKILYDPYWSIVACAAISTIVILKLYQSNSTVRDLIGDGSPSNKIGPNR